MFKFQSLNYKIEMKYVFHFTTKTNKKNIIVIIKTKDQSSLFFMYVEKIASF